MSKEKPVFSVDSFGEVRFKDTVLLTEKVLKQPDLQASGSSS